MSADILEQRIALAKGNKDELNALIADYLPFIRVQAASVSVPSLEFEDAQSIAMMVFTNCILQYCPDRGSFLAFAKACIRNRLIDEARKADKRPKIIPLIVDEEPVSGAEDSASLQLYDREQERRRLCGEIEELSKALSPFGVSFSELPRVCPRQARAKTQCLQIAGYIAKTPELREQLFTRRTLAQRELAEQFRLSVKTVEKHRKYIVSLVVLLSGDYPCIRSFIPQRKEAKP